MVRRKKDMVTSEQTELMGGNGMLQLVHILKDDEMQGVGRLFAVTVIPPGCSVGRHAHAGDFETYYILQGRAGVDDNGSYYELEPGDMTQCRDGDYHAIKNIGDGDLRYVAVILYSGETMKRPK